MNISYLIGNLTKDPQKVEGTKSSLCKLNLAVRENYTTADGERPTQFFNVAVWGAVADNCMKYLKKGSKVAVLGKIQNRDWEQDGVKRYSVEIVASEIEFISTPQGEKKAEQPKMTPIKDEDLPF